MPVIHSRFSSFSYVSSFYTVTLMLSLFSLFFHFSSFSPFSSFLMFSLFAHFLFVLAQPHGNARRHTPTKNIRFIQFWPNRLFLGVCRRALACGGASVSENCKNKQNKDAIISLLAHVSSLLHPSENDGPHTCQRTPTHAANY